MSGCGFSPRLHWILGEVARAYYSTLPRTSYSAGETHTIGTGSWTPNIFHKLAPVILRCIIFCTCCENVMLKMKYCIVLLMYTGGVGNNRTLSTSLSTHFRTSTTTTVVVIHVDPSTSELLRLYCICIIQERKNYSKGRNVEAYKWLRGLTLRELIFVNLIWNLHIKLTVCLQAQFEVFDSCY